MKTLHTFDVKVGKMGRGYMECEIKTFENEEKLGLLLLNIHCHWWINKPLFGKVFRREKDGDKDKEQMKVTIHNLEPTVIGQYITVLTTMNMRMLSWDIRTADSQGRKEKHLDGTPGSQESGLQGTGNRKRFVLQRTVHWSISFITDIGKGTTLGRQDTMKCTQGMGWWDGGVTQETCRCLSTRWLQVVRR